MTNIKKIRDYFKSFDQKKLNKLFFIILCIVICSFSLTFANNVLLEWYLVILPIFGSFIIFAIVIYLILRWWIIKNCKTENDLKIEKILKERKKEEKACLK